VAPANDNRHARKRRVKANASRSLATMTRIIQDIYGSESTKQPDADVGRDAAPESTSSP
jgi:hypothetical protein